MMITIFQHVDFEGPAGLATLLPDLGHQSNLVRLYRGEAVPPPTSIQALIVLGGPMAVHDTAAFPWLEAELACIRELALARKPVLGICLGAQLLASALGSSVYPNGQKEIGWFPLAPSSNPASGNLGEKLHQALAKLPGLTVFHWHGDTFDLPEGSEHLAASPGCPNQAFLWGDHALGFQFHLEVDQDAARLMVRHGAHELTNGPWIQQADSLIEGAKLYEQQTRLVLKEVLTALF